MVSHFLQFREALEIELLKYGQSNVRIREAQ